MGVVEFNSIRAAFNLLPELVEEYDDEIEEQNKAMLGDPGLVLFFSHSVSPFETF